MTAYIYVHVYVQMYTVCVCIDVDFVSHVCMCEGDCYTSVYVYEMVGVQINMLRVMTSIPRRKGCAKQLAQYMWHMGRIGMGQTMVHKWFKIH